MATAARPHAIGKSGKPRPSRRDITVARTGDLGADPEGIQLAIGKVEAESDRLGRHLRQIRSALPTHAVQRLVGANGPTIGRAERLHDATGGSHLAISHLAMIFVMNAGLDDFPFLPDVSRRGRLER